MSVAQGSAVKGRTRWKRFATVVVPATFIAGAIVFGQATGAIAASFSVSGQQFKVSADKLEGTGFVQYGGLATEKGGNPANPADPKNHFVAVSGIKSAKLYNLCQSVKVPGLPVSMVIHAGQAAGAPAEATDLLINLSSLKGDATFQNIQIGIDASDLTKGGDAKGLQGSFAQQADSVVITNLKQVAWSTTAGTFKLTGLDLSLSTGGTPFECF